VSNSEASIYFHAIDTESTAKALGFGFGALQDSSGEFRFYLSHESFHLFDYGDDWDGKRMFFSLSDVSSFLCGFSLKREVEMRNE